MQGCPSVPGATVERAPLTLGHTRIVASVPQAQKEVARGKFAGTSTLNFRVAEEMRSFKGMTWWIGGNLCKWRSQLEKLEGEVDLAL